MGRNLVLCLDGTAGEVRSRQTDSNPVQTYDLLDLSDPKKQIAYYSAGVGTEAAPGAWGPFARWLTRMGGLIWGKGLRANLGDAYLWLVKNWEPGDRIFVFGFSRGAFTARALVGMLRTIGLLRRGTENMLQFAVAEYAHPGGSENVDWKRIDRFVDVFCRHPDGRRTIPVEYLGVWDTVKALGLARFAPSWPFTRKLPNARRIRHAVSIDERRRPFRENLVDPAHPNCEEVWFAGVHADVGGTYADDCRLSTITLRWVLEGARQEGLLLKPMGPPDLVGTLFAGFPESDASGLTHRNNAVWDVLVPRRRPIPAKANVHATVRERMSALPAYRPRIPEDVVWVDADWTAPAPDVAAPAADDTAGEPPAMTDAAEAR